ncbi:MAG: hypothetical protein GY838_11675 [bacterium]|nr:hypothetical protein [bacterium]
MEFLVGDAKQATYFYRTAFGFDRVAYRGPETGDSQRASYVLQQNDIWLVFTTPLRHDDALNIWLTLHGDGVRDIAFEVNEIPGNGTGLTCIDHIVGNVEDRQMDNWVQWYDEVLGMGRFVSYDDKDISTEFTALRSNVVAIDDRHVKFPINEPADGRRKSQIQEYIDANLTPGVQHLALKTDDLASELKTRIRREASPRHVPAVLRAVPEIPRTLSGKTVELAVREALHGRPVANVDALANPDSLEHFRRLGVELAD